MIRDQLFPLHPLPSARPDPAENEETGSYFLKLEEESVPVHYDESKGRSPASEARKTSFYSQQPSGSGSDSCRGTSYQSESETRMSDGPSEHTLTLGFLTIYMICYVFVYLNSLSAFATPHLQFRHYLLAGFFSVFAALPAAAVVILAFFVGVIVFVIGLALLLIVLSIVSATIGGLVALAQRLVAEAASRRRSRD